MNVKLISYTPDPDRIVAVAARLCYSNISPEDLYYDLTEDEISNLIDIVSRNGHLSTFEHASFTFAISGISRSCTHQLVRHRIASYNQQSQRYVKFNGELQNIVPDSISEIDKAEELFNSAMNSCKQAYDDLLNLNVPPEDARYVLPNASPSNMIVTMNARELNHFFSIRCCNRAQWEIRKLAWDMLVEVSKVAPRLFSQAGPGCTRGNCTEGNMACGDPYPQWKY